MGSLLSALNNTLVEDDLAKDGLSNISMSTLTHGNIIDHLKNADENADAVETQTFGLETDDGDIVKVYVAIADADDFEKALGKKLGAEDDIEEILDDLADKFDIVDVVWPEEDEVATETQQGDEEVIHDIEQDHSSTSAEENSQNLDTALSGEKSDDTDKTAEKKGGLKKDSDVSSAEDSDVSSAEESSSEESSEESSSEESSSEESSSEESSEEDEEKPVKKGGLKKDKEKVDTPVKKGGLKKESSVLQYANNLILEAAEADPIIATMGMTNFYREAQNRYQKQVLEIIAILGVDGDALKPKYTKFKKNLKAAGEMVMGNTNLRIWLAKLLTAIKNIPSEVSGNKDKLVHEMNSLLSDVAIENISEADSTDSEGIMRMQIHNRVAAICMSIIEALGCTEELIRNRRYSIRKSVTLVAKNISKDARAKMALLMVASALGIAKDSQAFHIVAPDEKKKMDEEDKAQAILNDSTLDEADTDPNEVVPGEINNILGTSAYAQTVNKLVTLLGIPSANLNYQNFQLKQFISTKQRSLIDMSSIMQKMQQLITVLEESIAPEVPEEMSRAKMIAGNSSIYEDHEAADLGTWDISNVDGVINMKVDDFQISIKDDIEDLLDAIGDGDVYSAKSHNVRVTFRPTNRGRDYIVKLFGDTKFPNGVFMNKQSIDSLANVIASIA